MTGASSTDLRKRRKQVASFQIRGASTICMETCGSWYRIISGRTQESRRSIPEVPAVQQKDKHPNTATLKEEDPISTAPREYGRPPVRAVGGQTFAPDFAC